MLLAPRHDLPRPRIDSRHGQRGAIHRAGWCQGRHGDRAEIRADTQLSQGDAAENAAVDSVARKYADSLCITLVQHCDEQVRRIHRFATACGELRRRRLNLAQHVGGHGTMPAGRGRGRQPDGAQRLTDAAVLLGQRRNEMNRASRGSHSCRELQCSTDDEVAGLLLPTLSDP